MEFTDRQLTIIRRALALYGEQGADGMTTETWNLHKIFVAEDLSRKEKTED